MPLGILTDEQLNKELNRVPSNKEIEKIEKSIESEVCAPKIVDIKRGRGNQLEIPNEIRALVAEEAINGTPAKDLARTFGISESSISAYKNDATSTTSYDKPNEELAKKNDSVRTAISNQARTRLSQALEEITPEKISGAKVKDISGIAKDMSVIVKNLEENIPQNVQNTQVIIYKPRFKEEDDYDIITVNE